MVRISERQNSAGPVRHSDTSTPSLNISRDFPATLRNPRTNRSFALELSHNPSFRSGHLAKIASLYRYIAMHLCELPPLTPEDKVFFSTEVGYAGIALYATGETSWSCQETRHLSDRRQIKNFGSGEY